jgi:hypothetical protein
MTAQASVSDAFTFVGGLNTEGGYFITPENSYKEGVNVIPKLDGSIERRNGLDYEALHQLYAASITADQKDLWAFSSGVWSTVAGNGNLDFFVVQLGPTLHFYNAASGTISATKKTFTVNLEDYRATNNTEIAGTGVCSYAPTYGRLIVTSQNTFPIIIEYKPDTETIEVKRVDIRTRDFKGKSLIDNNGNVVPITAEYTQAEWESLGININDVVYNLNNQGWKSSQINAYQTANGGRYPANTKSWIYGKDSNDDFSATVLNKQDFGNSPAPKGSFVIDPFIPTSFRPKACAFFAGRAWYAGLPSSELLGTVFFSQVLDDVSKVGNCYQTNDPTSEVISDLLDSDGGTIEIPEAGEIVSLQPLGRGIMVFATNGVWFISGIDSGFTAANYSVDRITNVGCFAAKSIVPIEDAIIYWSNGGVYAITPANSIEYSARNISDQNIKNFYQDIPVLGKLYVEGSYNATDKIIYWMYSNTLSSTTSGGRYNKDTVLAYDINLQSWYWFSLNTTVGVIPISIETTKETNSEGETYNVLAGIDEVFVGTDNVVATVPTVSGTRKIFKILTLHPVTNNEYSVTFSDFINTRDSSTKFKDWYSFNNMGAEEECYFVTGYNMGGVGPARAKTAQYLTVFLKRTETSFDVNGNPINESSCLLQTRWDFTDNSGAGKWSPEVQVYRQLRPFFVAGAGLFDDGYPLVISKNKLRGRGKAVQFKYAAETGKDMKIVGWTGSFIGNTNV